MSRYILNTEDQQKEMLEYLGMASTNELFKDIPESVRLDGMLDLPLPLSEMELVSHMRELSEKNIDCSRYACFLGAGAYDHHIPSAVAHIISRQEFYTAYTPYQPEISQGTLQAIFEYQTMICELTGMDAANASMYDGATAVVEAAVLACRTTRRKKVLAARTLHPESRKVLATYSRFNGSTVEEVGYRNGRIDTDELGKKLDPDTAAIIYITQ